MHDGIARPDDLALPADTPLRRRGLLKAAAGLGVAALGSTARAQAFDF
jgi:hypothetical protein